MDRSDLIEQYINLKKVHQELFFKHKKLQTQYEDLRQEHNKLKQEIQSGGASRSVLNENKRLVARVSQLNRISASISLTTPRKTSTPTLNASLKKKKTPKRNDTSSQVYEVERLMKHRGRKGNREFLVRWKGFGPKDDTWTRENELSCPKILNQYIQKHRLAL